MGNVGLNRNFNQNA